MNNSESASISTGLYKKLTSAFLAWAVNWVKGGPDAGVSDFFVKNIK